MVQLTLDTSSSRPRNAIWFLPSTSYMTTLRLQFIINPSEVAGIQSVLQKVLGKSITISSPTVIARKSTSYRDLGIDKDTGKQIFGGEVKPEVILSLTLVDAAYNFNFSLYLDFCLHGVQHHATVRPCADL